MQILATRQGNTNFIEEYSPSNSTMLPWKFTYPRIFGLKKWLWWWEQMDIKGGKGNRVEFWYLGEGMWTHWLYKVIKEVIKLKKLAIYTANNIGKEEALYFNRFSFLFLLFVFCFAWFWFFETWFLYVTAWNSLCRLGWPQTQRSPCLSSQALDLKVCTSTTWLTFSFWNLAIESPYDPAILLLGW